MPIPDEKPIPTQTPERPEPPPKREYVPPRPGSIPEEPIAPIPGPPLSPPSEPPAPPIFSQALGIRTAARIVPYAVAVFALTALGCGDTAPPRKSNDIQVKVPGVDIKVNKNGTDIKAPGIDVKTKKDS